MVVVVVVVVVATAAVVESSALLGLVLLDHGRKWRFFQAPLLLVLRVG